MEQYSVHYISSYYLTSSQNLLTVWNCYFLKYTQECYTKNVFIHLMLDNTSENISDFSNFHFFYSLLLLFLRFSPLKFGNFINFITETDVIYISSTLVDEETVRDKFDFLSVDETSELELSQDSVELRFGHTASVNPVIILKQGE